MRFPNGGFLGGIGSAFCDGCWTTEPGKMILITPEGDCSKCGRPITAKRRRMSMDLPVELQIENAISSLLRQVTDNPATDFTAKQAASVESLANALRVLRIHDD